MSIKMSHLYEVYLRSTGVCTDTRKIQKGNIFFALKGDNFNGNLYASEALSKGAIAAVVDEPVEVQNGEVIQVQDVLQSLQKLSTHHRIQFDIPIIGLTGSNGKTTTKELLYQVLSKKYKVWATKGNYNNHIGVPLTLLELTPDYDMAIIEMGANHVGEIELLSNISRPTHGMITNIGKAHLEGFGGVEGIFKGKTELFRFLEENNGYAFINSSDVRLRDTPTMFHFDFETYDMNGMSVKEEAQTLLSYSYQNHRFNTQMVGEYNLQNIAAAICVGKYFKVPDHDIHEAIESYRPSNNRSECYYYNGNLVIMDAYNANPTSMSAAIIDFAKQSKKKYYFLGNMLELGESSNEEHANIIQILMGLDEKNVFLIGQGFRNLDIDHPYIVVSRAEDLNDVIDWKNIHDSAILFKGSRGAALEKIAKLHFNYQHS